MISSTTSAGDPVAGTTRHGSPGAGSSSSESWLLSRAAGKK